MALGEFNMFSWKSKAAQQKEQEEYAKWAFPRGQKQRDNLEKLLRELYPKEPSTMTLISFLTCKELYERAIKSDDSSGNAIDTVMFEQKKYRQTIKRKDITTYIALVIADVGIDEQCEYPTADEIRAHALELGVKK